MAYPFLLVVIVLVINQQDTPLFQIAPYTRNEHSSFSGRNTLKSCTRVPDKSITSSSISLATLSITLTGFLASSNDLNAVKCSSPCKSVMPLSRHFNRTTSESGVSSPESAALCTHFSRP